MCRWEVLNPASMKQALVEGSVPIPGIPMYEQGQGKLNLINSMSILQNYRPKASIVPKALDFTDCPYMWPFCTQPIYANALPLIFNATVLNAMALTGMFTIYSSSHLIISLLLILSLTVVPYCCPSMLVQCHDAQCHGSCRYTHHLLIHLI